jgi:hypothetical protein
MLRVKIWPKHGSYLETFLPWDWNDHCCWQNWVNSLRFLLPICLVFDPKHILRQQTIQREIGANQADSDLTYFIVQLKNATNRCFRDCIWVENGI